MFCKNIECGKDIQDPKLGQLYCSKRCKRETENRIRRIKRNNNDSRTITCHRYACENVFVPKSVNHKYCSETCGKLAKNDKKLLESIERDIDPAILRAKENELVRDQRRRMGDLQRELLKAESLKASILSEVQDYMKKEMEPVTKYVLTGSIENNYSRSNPPYSDAHFLLSDPQGGKWNGEVGLKILLEDYLPKLQRKILTCVEVQRSEGPVEHLFIHMLGDLVEGCTIYPGQRNELDRYKNGDSAVHQVMVMVEAIKTLLIEPLRPHFKKMTVTNAYGNHGRNGSKLDPSLRHDNLDLLVGHILKMVCAPLDVDWVVPETDDHYVVNSQGWNLGGIHGHQFGQKASLNAMETNILRWDAINYFGAPLDVLLMGHRHNPAAVQIQGIDIVQNGAIDGGSNWFTATNGSWSAPSQEFFFVNEEYGMTGHRHLYVTSRVPRVKQRGGVSA